MFLDACHAEGIEAAVGSRELHDLADPKVGSIFFASCTLQQKSFENEAWKHGAFTKRLLDLLRDEKFDVSGNGLANTDELEPVIKAKVSVLTGQRQRPQVFSPRRLRENDLLEFQNSDAD